MTAAYDPHADWAQDDTYEEDYQEMLAGFEPPLVLVGEAYRRGLEFYIEQREDVEP